MPGMSTLFHEKLPNGLWLIAESIDTAQSLSMSLLTPAGVVYQPEDQQGLAAILTEHICRGAGGRTAREHSDELGRLGVQRGVNAGGNHLILSATMIGSMVDEALPLLVDMICRPNLDGQSLEPCRELAIQAIDGLMDEPQERVMLELRNRYYPEPLGRSPYGYREHITGINLDQILSFHQRQFVPGGSIIAFAGRLDYDHLKAKVCELTDGWHGQVQEPDAGQPSPRQYHHIESETAQVHLALAYPAVPEPDENSMLQRAACAVLSGGMSSRLFTEVREKRGLCYAVSARYASHKTHGAVMTYAGTVPDRAQQTYDVLHTELIRLSEGIQADEFERAIVGMKSRLVMQGESTAARANAIATDQFVLGRPRSLDEIAARVDRITLDDLNGFIASNRPGEMTTVSIGPVTLKVD